MSSLSARNSLINSTGTVTGNKTRLWSRIREAESLHDLLALTEEAGFHRVVVPRSSLLRAGVEEPDFGAILGQLGAFGAILECKTANESGWMQRELARRELDLISLGLAKRSINELLKHIQLAKNQGKSACLVIDDCAPPDISACSVSAPLRECRRRLLSAGELPAVIYGVGNCGTVRLIEEDASVTYNADAASSARRGTAASSGCSPADTHAISSWDKDDGMRKEEEEDDDDDDDVVEYFDYDGEEPHLLLQEKRCKFANMMLVAYNVHHPLQHALTNQHDKGKLLQSTPATQRA